MGEQQAVAGFSVAQTVTDQQVAYLLSAGFEGGSYGVGYWCRIMKYRKPRVADRRPVLDQDEPEAKRTIYPYTDYPLLKGGAVVCRDCSDCSDDTDEKYTPLVLDRAAIERGLKLMSEKYPRHWSDFLTEHYDATTGDVFIQCCLLGDIVYG